MAERSQHVLMVLRPLDVSNKLIRICQTAFNKFYFIRKNSSM